MGTAVRSVSARDPVPGPLSLSPTCPAERGAIRYGQGHEEGGRNGTPDAVRLVFSCPMCRRNTATRIHRAAFGALRIAGASFRLLTRPAEADEVHHGPPLTADDVDAFCTAMDDPAWPLLA